MTRIDFGPRYVARHLPGGGRLARGAADVPDRVPDDGAACNGQSRRKGMSAQIVQRMAGTGTKPSCQLGRAIVRFRQKPTLTRAFSTDVGKQLWLSRILPVRSNFTGC